MQAIDDFMGAINSNTELQQVLTNSETPKNTVEVADAEG